MDKTEQFGILPYIFISVAVAFSLRLAPFVFFKDENKISANIKYIGKYLPQAIITAIVIYCLRNLDITVYPYGIKEIMATIVVVSLHIWKSNMLLSVFAGTVFYMILVQNLWM